MAHESHQLLATPLLSTLLHSLDPTLGPAIWPHICDCICGKLSACTQLHAEMFFARAITLWIYANFCLRRHNCCLLSLKNLSPAPCCNQTEGNNFIQVTLLSPGDAVCSLESFSSDLYKKGLLIWLRHPEASKALNITSDPQINISFL